MSFLPLNLWSRKLDATQNELEELKYHTQWGYNYLVRIPGWEEAATIIHQHHEHVNGAGYPDGLKGDEIHDGAKILAILDTFFLLTNGRVDQSLRQSTVRAISAVNARVDTEFEGMWVQCFNHMIRGELKAGHI
jgi:HD-GYP domain-containing protein (c-di-GMP phosphodiesterase class II)